MKKREALLTFLLEFINEQRTELFFKNAEQRTNYISIILEDIYQSQNASAVIRTCDCFGIQNIHVIENRNQYRINPDVALGSSQWVNITRYNKQENNTLHCIETLKKNGYRIVATSPHENQVFLPDFNLQKGKCAFLFGTEKTGLSAEALKQADEHLCIPMYGFTESLNISVSVAIVLYELSTRLKNSDIEWTLSPEEKTEVLITWALKSLRRPNLLLKKFEDLYAEK